MDFHVTEYEKFIDIISGSILQLIFKRLPLVKFWLVSMMNSPKYLKSLLKYYFISQLLICVGLNFLLYILTPQTYNRLNAEADMKIKLSSIQLDIKEIYKKM